MTAPSVNNYDQLEQALLMDTTPEDEAPTNTSSFEPLANSTPNTPLQEQAMQQEETLDDEEDPGFPMSPVSQKSPEPSKITAKRSLQLKQAPTKKQDQEAKKQRLEEAKKNTAPSATHWIARWTKENTIQPEINCLFGKSSLDIQEQEERIITSFTYPQQRTGGITASLARLLEPKSINVVKSHVFSAFMSTLLPALVVIHLKKFSSTVIKRWQSASFIRWEFQINKAMVELQVLMGEIIFFSTKAQHEIQFGDDWITALLRPMKTYMTQKNIMKGAMIELRS